MFKKLLLLILCVILICFCFTGCNRKQDYVSIYNKSYYIFDDIDIELKDGYFYKSHEKFTVDDNTVGITIYFSNEAEDDSWD
jgi:hypothetical protein